MTEQAEPFVYPSRDPRQYPYNPGVPDRQMWAIGMIIVQWGMTEFIIEQQVIQLVGEDQSLKRQYKEIRNAQQNIDFWQSLTESNVIEPRRTSILELIKRVRNLNSQRDEVVHRLWGGGMQAGSWSAEHYETTDAALLRKTGDQFKTKSTDARATLSWRLTFNRLRQMAREMATLNRDLFQTFMLPPS